MALGDDLDRDAIRAGVRMGLLLVVPAGVFTAALHDDLPQILAVLFVVVFLTGFFMAGNVTAKQATRAALPSASVAAASTYLLLQVPLSMIRLRRGEPLNILTYIFLVLTAMSCGVIGGLFAQRAKVRAEQAAQRAAERADAAGDGDATRL